MVVILVFGTVIFNSLHSRMVVCNTLYYYTAYILDLKQ